MDDDGWILLLTQHAAAAYDSRNGVTEIGKIYQFTKTDAWSSADPQLLPMGPQILGWTITSLKWSDAT